MGYLSMAPSSSSLASSPCLRTFGFSRSQLSFGQFEDHHAILLSHRQRELLNVSVRPKQIQLLVCPAYLRDITKRVDRPSITRGMEMLDYAAGDVRDKKTMLEGLEMLKKLAADGNNRRAMRSLFGLLSLVMAPLSSDLHRIDHDAWSRLAAVSLKLMWLLVYDPSPPQRASTMKDEMAANKEEIKTSMNRIVKCDKCNEQLRMLAKKIHKQVVKIH